MGDPYPLHQGEVCSKKRGLEDCVGGSKGIGGGQVGGC